MARGDEAKMSDSLINHMNKLVTSVYDGLHVESRIKVISDFTCIKEKDKFRLSVGFSEVDLAIYTRLPISKGEKTIRDHFKFIQDAKSDTDFINIPLAIIELKSGKLISEAIDAKNVIARRIRNVFPFCAAYFIAENTSKREETLMRHGKDFSAYFIFKVKFSNENMDDIFKRFIKPHIDNLRANNLI